MAKGKDLPEGIKTTSDGNFFIRSKATGEVLIVGPEAIRIYPVGEYEICDPDTGSTIADSLDGIPGAGEDTVALAETTEG